ncbi:SnoaL-like protein [Georgenia soli]|uniref:SnoaL-like protein n=1 Tax=Georgenia soli TaxID=638953 RepID=A0A2A9EPN0_9MICO|nr:SnoaL-like protein [Georgenia soli]
MPRQRRAKDDPEHLDGPPVIDALTAHSAHDHADRGAGATGTGDGGAAEENTNAAEVSRTRIEELASWIDGYIRAWNSNDPDDIASLFTVDAEYRTEPFADPVEGRDAIVAYWLANSDEPGRTTFAWTPVVVTSNVAVVEGTTDYRDDPPRTYSNLWVLRLDGSGRCTSFTEWWMQHPTEI